MENSFFVYSSNHLWSHGSVSCYITCALLPTCSQRTQTLLCTKSEFTDAEPLPFVPFFQPNKLVQIGCGSKNKEELFYAVRGKIPDSQFEF